ncbi:MAG: glycosyltransferase family 39 protein, partial [Dokdonella sp.]
MPIKPLARDGIKILLVLAAIRLAVYLLFDGRYGFHRDELQVLEDARHLAWGYVAYPPLTPFLGRVELLMFGTSLTGFRFFSALAQCIAMVLAGLIARELGGRRSAQIIAAIATAFMPFSMLAGAQFEYVTFDFLWWVLLAWLMLRLINSENPRWWLAIGAVIG